MYFTVVRVFVICALTAIALLGCGGSSDGKNNPPPSSLTPTPVFIPSPTPLPAPAVTVTISGSLSFDLVPHDDSGALDYSATRSQAIRGATVQALDEHDVLLAETSADSEGRYALRVGEELNVRIRVLAGLLRLGVPSWDFSVTDNTNGNALYVMQGELISSGTTNSVRDLHATSGWDGMRYRNPRVAAPFAILDAVYQALHATLEAEPNAQFLPAELRWSVDNTPVPGNVSEGHIGTSYFDPYDNHMYILGDDNNDTDEYDRSVIQHEWAHYLESTRSRSDSIGGSHGIDASLDMRLAFGEGFANAFAAIVSQQPFYADSRGTRQARGFRFSLEHNTVNNVGWYNENSVGKFIYDLADANNEVGDELSLGLVPIYSVLSDSRYIDSPAFTSIYLFGDVLTQQNPALTAQIDRMLSREAITGRGAYGEGESNDSAANLTYVLPVYRSLDNGGTVDVCGNNGQGEYNGLGVRRYIRVAIVSAGNYAVSATKTLGTGERDPEILIRQRGNVLRYMTSNAVNEERGNVTLAEGDYIFEVYDRLNSDGLTGGGTACFEVSLQQM